MRLCVLSSVWWCPLLFSVRLCIHLFVVGLMSYLCYSCLFTYSGVLHILCCVFVCFFFILCNLCWQFLCIVFVCFFFILCNLCWQFLCIVFVCFFFILCTLCWQFLWIVLLWLPLRYSPMLFDYINGVYTTPDIYWCNIHPNLTLDMRCVSWTTDYEIICETKLDNTIQ